MSIFEKVLDYIIYDISEYSEEEIFTFSSLEDLGAYYTNKVSEKFEIDTSEIIRSIIDINKSKNIILDYTGAKLWICKTAGIKHLPKEVLETIKIKYKEVFVTKRKDVSELGDQKVNYYNSLIANCNEKIASLKSECNRNKNVIKDISIYDKKYEEEVKKIANLNTKIETVKSFIISLEKTLMKYADISSELEVYDAIRKTAIDLSRCEIITDGTENVYNFYNEIIEIIRDNIEKDYLLFFNVKVTEIYNRISKAFRSRMYETNSNREEELKINIKKIPSALEFSQMKSIDLDEYIEKLEYLVNEFAIISNIRNNINSSYAVVERKSMLVKSIEMFLNEEWEMFLNLLPIQIEGAFNDLLNDMTTFKRFTDLNHYVGLDLKSKIRTLTEYETDHLDIWIYYSVHFNNRVRNVIAHGNHHKMLTNPKVAKSLSLELLLDLNTFLDIIDTVSESSKMMMFYNNYIKSISIISNDEINYGAILNDLCGQRIHHTLKGTIFRCNTIQLVYWILNPYYESIYVSLTSNSDLFDLREIICSCEFWKFVANEIKNYSRFSPYKFNYEFISAMKIIIGYVDDSNVKKEIANVIQLFSAFLLTYDLFLNE